MGVRAVLVAAVVVTAPVCAAAQMRDAAWAQRQIIEAQCGTWARDQARDEYVPQIRAARQQVATMSAQRGSTARTGAALAASNIGLLQLAQQSREKELTEACTIQREAELASRWSREPTPRQEDAAPAPLPVAPAHRSSPTPSKLDDAKRDACDWGAYWSSAQQRCLYIGGE